MNTTTRAAFATVADADVFASHKATRPVLLSDQDFAVVMAKGWAAIATLPQARPDSCYEQFGNYLHQAMGWRADHDTSGLTF